MRWKFSNRVTKIIKRESFQIEVRKRRKWKKRIILNSWKEKNKRLRFKNKKKKKVREVFNRDKKKVDVEGSENEEV